MIWKRGFRYLKKAVLFSFLFLFFFVFPLNCWADAELTSDFGWRIDPVYGDHAFHAGVDIAYEFGTPVPSFYDGQIIMAGDYEDGYGNQVLIYNYNENTFIRYGHFDIVYVTAGQYVSAGTVVGLVGSTGKSTGPHLHLEYIVSDGGGGYTYTDPLILFGLR